MKAPVKAGRESRMPEPYQKGEADHLDPESCAEAGNRVGDARARGTSCGFVGPSLETCGRTVFGSKLESRVWWSGSPDQNDRAKSKGEMYEP